MCFLWSCVDSSNIFYSKAATFFRMAANFVDVSLRFYAAGEAEEVGIFRESMQAMIHDKQFSTLSFFDWMQYLYNTVGRRRH
jgi:hypothetical protein